MPCNVEDATEVIIGETYLVNAVWTHPSRQPWQGARIAILGGLHEDFEIIKFPYLHYHVDWRFVTQAMIDNIVNCLEKNYDRKNDLYKNYLLGLPITTNASTNDRTGTPVRIPLKCERQHQMWDENVAWLPALERAYLNQRAEMDLNPESAESFTMLPAESFIPMMPPATIRPTCRTCPHRGISLVGAPVDERGAVVCPGHGLAWDKDTGILRPRTMLTVRLQDFIESKAV